MKKEHCRCNVCSNTPISEFALFSQLMLQQLHNNPKVGTYITDNTSKTQLNPRSAHNSIDNTSDSHSIYIDGDLVSKITTTSKSNNSSLESLNPHSCKLSLPSRAENSKSHSRSSNTSSNTSRRNLKALTPTSALMSEPASFEDSHITDNTVALNDASRRNSSKHESTPPNNDNETDPLNTNNEVSMSPNSQVTNSSRRFSFNKRPLSQSSVLQRKSSQISCINNYPPQRCDSVNKDIDHSKFYSKYKGILKNKDELPDTALNDLSFEYNYDEKIRAPRMSVVSLLSKDSSHVNKASNISSSNQKLHAKRKTSAPAVFATNANSNSNSNSNSSSFNTLDSLQEEQNISKDLQSSYKPASYDLTQKLRKLSMKAERECDDISLNSNSVDSNHILPEDKKLLLMAKNNKNSTENSLFPTGYGNYTYQIINRKKSFVSNTSSNISPTREKFLKDDFKPVKQIDGPKKLMDNYVPPVLRPIEDSTYDLHKLVQNKSSTDAEVKLAGTLNPIDSPQRNSEGNKSPKLSKVHHQLINQIITKNSNSQPSDSLDRNYQSIYETLITPPTTSGSKDTTNQNYYHKLNKNKKNIEPSHDHWKPNEECNSCEYCDSSFTLFKRKHHCRHCGGIFCSNCLNNFANLNLLAHFERPNDFHKSQMHLKNPLLSPIVSNETYTTNSTTLSNGTISQSSHEISNDYAKFCKVCPVCYTLWLQFLASDEDYEGKLSNYNDFFENESRNNQNKRKESITNVPSDWNWSSF